MPAPMYKHPPIEEAICDFTFGPPNPNKQLDLSIPGKLQSHDNLKDEYTGEVKSQNVQSIIAGANQAVSVQNALHRIQLTTLDSKRIVAVGARNLGVSVLKPYEGWTNFRHRIEKALYAYYDVARPEYLSRLGVRYINRIIVPEPNAVPTKYLSNLSAQQTNINGTLAGFMYRSEFSLPNDVKTIISQATLKPIKTDTTEFLLDIDVVCEKEPVYKLDEILKIADHLHDIEGKIFESLITADSRSLFDA